MTRGYCHASVVGKNFSICCYQVLLGIINMNKDIELSIKNGELVLFLGAGASRKCKTNSGDDLFDGRALAEELARRASMDYSDEDLEDVYGAVRDAMGARLDSILEELFRHVSPSDEYSALAEFAWRRIYTDRKSVV